GRGAFLEPLVLFPELASVAVIGFVALSAALQVGVLTFELGDYSLCFFGGLCERIALDSDLCYLMCELRHRLFEFVFSPGRLLERSAVALFLNARSKPFDPGLKLGDSNRRHSRRCVVDDRREFFASERTMIEHSDQADGA